MRAWPHCRGRGGAGAKQPYRRLGGPVGRRADDGAYRGASPRLSPEPDPLLARRQWGLGHAGAGGWSRQHALDEQRCTPRPRWPAAACPGDPASPFAHRVGGGGAGGWQGMRHQRSPAVVGGASSSLESLSAAQVASLARCEVCGGVLGMTLLTCACSARMHDVCAQSHYCSPRTRARPASAAAAPARGLLHLAQQRQQRQQREQRERRQQRERELDHRAHFAAPAPAGDAVGPTERRQPHGRRVARADV